MPAVDALLQAPVAGNPVAIVAGTLKPSSKSLKLALPQHDALRPRLLRRRTAATQVVAMISPARSGSKSPRRRPPHRRQRGAIGA